MANYYNTSVEQAEDIPENIKCPYCGAGNSPDNELCGGCAKNLLIPAGVRAEVKARKTLNAGPTAVRAYSEGIPTAAQASSSGTISCKRPSVVPPAFKKINLYKPVRVR